VTEKLPASDEDDPLADQRERAEFKRFIRISCRFVLGLAIVVFAVDRRMGVYLDKSGHRGGISPDIQRAIDNVENDPHSVRVIVMGDSVARQFFPHGSEPSREVRILTTNAGVTTAGQYYLAQHAMQGCDHLTDIYLILLPPAWRNNMPRQFTHDYFCGHFHTPAQVAEVFAVKRDIELSFAHLCRCLMPNLMAANSLSQPATAVAPGAGEPAPVSAGETMATDPERLLSALSGWIGPAADPIPAAPPGKCQVYFSPTSKYFFNKLKNDCRERGIHLHVLPCPVSSERFGYEFIDPAGVYDGPIINDVPASQLVDNVHFKQPYVAAMRRRVIELYHLEFLDHRGAKIK
jgi:hypothetical protein